jgi:hypothetical protein
MTQALMPFFVFGFAFTLISLACVRVEFHPWPA